MKIFTKIIMCALMVTMLGGCSVSYKKDYLSKYSKYLQYSLGDYKLLNKETVKWTSDPIPQTNTGLSWTVGYTDSTRKKQEFTFYNYAKNNDDAYFGEAVLRYAVSKSNNDLNISLIKKYFPIRDEKNKNAEVSAESKMWQPTDDTFNYEKCISTRKGIILKKITPAELLANLECTTYLNVYTTVKDTKKLAEIVKTTKLLMIDYCTAVELDTLKCTIEGVDDAHGYELLYNKVKNSFSIKTNTQVEHEYDYPDEHARVITDLLVNDKKITTGLYQNYSTVTKCYYFRHTTISDILEALGYNVITEDKKSMLHGEYTSYTWAIKDDKYEWIAEKQTGYEYIYKNKGKIKFSYDLGKDGISSVDFDKLFGTISTIDDHHKRVIITNLK